jgi:epoxyqueuosine reductase
VNLTQVIKEQAHRLGFALAGITTPEPLPHAQVFEGWLREGRQGEMAYLDSPRSKRCRAYPKNILPDCRAVLVLAAPYSPPPRLVLSGRDDVFPLGSIAAYAWGDDYHTVLAGRLHNLVEFIERQVGQPVPHRWYTDTGPLLERELAQRAGLGWIGKNTCLINPYQGSYFFLAEILLGIELEPDQPFMVDRCGSCRRCVSACPSGCILPDRTLDARHCISYLTIELKGPIPPGLRPLLGTHVFGCDVCQQVCPWNRFASKWVDPTFTTHLVQPEINLLEQLALSASQFNTIYCHSPIKRAKRRGYLRNIAVAFGNLHHPQAVGALAQQLAQEPEPLVRQHLAWALGQIGGILATKALERLLESEADPLVRQEVQNSLVNS